MCIMNGPVCDAAWKASAVFLGRVSEITFDPLPAQPIRTAQERAALDDERTHIAFDVLDPFGGMEGRCNEKLPKNRGQTKTEIVPFLNTWNLPRMVNNTRKQP